MKQKPVQTKHNILIELSVPDFNVAKSFYKIFGFKVAWEEAPKGMNGYLVMKREESVLCFFCGNEQVTNHPYFKKFDPNTKRGFGVEFSIPVDGIEKYWQEVSRQLDAKHIMQPLRLQPWGIKDFRIEDPFGYYFRVNEPTDIISELLLGEKEY